MDIRAHLESLVRRLIEAENAASRKDVDKILSADFLGITRADGSEQDRAGLLRAIEGSKAQDRVRELEQPAMVSHGAESGVVRSVVMVRLSSDRAAVVGRFRNTHSFCLEGGEWHCVGWQVTRLAVPGLASKMLPVARDAVAPDKSDVRVLLDFKEGGMAHFELPPGQVSRAVSHRTVSEIWYILGGRGEMWRRLNDAEEVIPLQAGLCLTLPLGTLFQFRSFGHEPLSALGVTMPRWHGDDEAFEVDGRWKPTL
jgi:mannose-6-phosphate isomerase-like protein (cupin superfamily)